MFYIKGKSKDGAVNTVHLNCEEEYGLICSGCGKEEVIDGDFFYNFAKDPGVYEGRWLCDECKATGASGLKLGG